MGEKKALIIGINEYEDPGFENLKYAESDARAIYNILINPDIGDFTKDGVILLTGESKSKVEENLETTLNEAKKDDLVFIYFAGHGKLDKSGNLCLAARNTKTDRLLATSVHLENIRRIMDQSDCRRVVFIIDSCFSGAAGQSFRSGDVPAESFEQISGQGKVIISASQAYERARERDDIGHGIFTYNLIKGLEEGEADHDEDGYISIEDLYRHVYDKVKSETKGQQVPMRWGSDQKGEIVIAKSIKNLEKKRAEIERLSKNAIGLQNQGRLDEALETWNKVIELDSKNIEAPQRIKQIEGEKKKRAELEAKIDRLFDYYKKGSIPGTIYNKAVGIIRNPQSALGDKEKTFSRLVEDLLNNYLSVENFVLSWNRIEKPESQTEIEKLKQEEERKAQAEKIKQEEERRRQEQIAGLYDQALVLVGNGQWRQALEKMKEIQVLDPQFADSEGIAARAQEELEKEAERLERERQEREAREKAAREEAEKAREEELKRKTDKSKARHTSPWVYGTVGGLIVLALLIVGLWEWYDSQKQTQEKFEPYPLSAEQAFNKGKEYYESGNYDSALPLFQRAAEAGNAAAMNYLGVMYEKGLGVERDYDKAVRWYRKGAEAGNTWAMTNLGVMYEKGLGVEKDYNEAMRWYRKGAEAGNALAMTNLGYMYENGFGIKRDYGEAVHWYRKGAEAGNALAMSNLGYMYREGLGIERDYGRSVHWLTKGAEAGEVLAMNNLGYMYENGLGVEKDHNEAVRWYNKASSLGDETAKDALKRLGEVEVTIPLPEILDFGAEPSTIKKGEKSTLSWEISNAKEVEISGIGKVELTGSKTVSPTETTTYTLIARNEEGKTDEREVRVKVDIPLSPVRVKVDIPLSPPKIGDFKAIPGTIEKGESSTLSWKTSNAKEVTLNGKKVIPSDSVKVKPEKTTAYTLVARSEEGKTVEREVRIEVKIPITPPKDKDPDMVQHPERYIKILDWSFYVAFNGVAIIHHVTIENTSDITYKDVKVRVRYYSGSGIEVSGETKILPVTVPPHSKNTYLEEGFVLGGGTGDMDAKNIEVLGAVSP